MDDCHLSNITKLGKKAHCLQREWQCVGTKKSPSRFNALKVYIILNSSWVMKI